LARKSRRSSISILGSMANDVLESVGGSAGVARRPRSTHNKRID
jgi:hypothetical protein